MWQRRYTLNSPALKGIDATLQGIKSQGTLQLLTSSRKTNDGAKIAKPSELAKREYKELPFTGQYLKLLAKPAEGFKMMISAEPGTGKSYFSLQFAKYLTQFGRVLYATSEEYGTATLAKKLKEILVPDTVDISGTVKGLDLSPYKFIFMDSINDMDLSLDEFKALKQAHPETAFILIMQNNKDGSFKGRNEWPHEMDIVVHGVGYKKFNVSKNRFK